MGLRYCETEEQKDSGIDFLHHIYFQSLRMAKNKLNFRRALRAFQEYKLNL